MVYRKIEEVMEDCLLVYFVDSNNRRQGELFCYKTEGRLPSTENLLFTELYKEGILLTKKWMKLPQPILV